MSLSVKLIKSAISSGKQLIQYPTKYSKQTKEAILTLKKNSQQASMLRKSKGIASYRVKPDITIPIRIKTLKNSSPATTIKWDLLAAKDEIQLAELGNVSMRLADKYKLAEVNAIKEIHQVFGKDFEAISIRAKGANSVFSKLERMSKKGKLNFKTDEEAEKVIQDAIGGRIILKDLTSKDVAETINNVKIDGKLLTAREKELVNKLLKNEPIETSEKLLAETLAKPVKLALAERHSEPAFRKFMLSGLKDALNRKVTTFEKLEQSGIRKDLLEELKTNPNIKPLRMTEVNNYKGINGIAYFSDNQISQFERLQLATGEKIDMITCSESIDLAKYGIENLPKSAKDAIKPSGYTTGQINVKLSDGTLAEIQVRGSGPFGEYEHFRYDAIQGKNTLSKILDGYKQAVQSLAKNEKDAKEYDDYISKFYDYYRKPELGIATDRPKLAEKFDKILSEENMQRLYKLDKKEEELKMKTFKPHFETVA